MSLEFKSHWVNSEYPSMIIEVFENLKDKEATLHLLLQDKIEFKLNVKINWKGMKMPESTFLLNLLFLSGYLTLAPDEDQPENKENRCFVIPNEELRR